MANPSQPMQFPQGVNPQRPMYPPSQGLPQGGPIQGSMQVPIPGQMSSPTKDVNTTNACKVGQETVQEIVQKTTEVFQCLKVSQLPNGAHVTIQACNERKVKLDECLKAISQLFRKLRMLYDKVQETCVQYGQESTQNLIPWEDGEPREEKPKNLDVLKYVSEEHKEAAEQLRLKNQQLKMVIDHLRTIIWEVNAMMATRKT